MLLNEEYIVKIIDVDNKGNGIAKIDNFVIFIKGALKDEKLKIKTLKQEKNCAYGKIIEILEKSSDRVNSLCPYYGLCGGCNFLHTTMENENNIKENYIKRLFPSVKVNFIQNDYEYNYRNKVTLHVKDNKIGYYKEKTNELIEIDKCLLLDEGLNDTISIIKKFDLSNIKEIVLRKTYFTNEVMICFDNKLNDKDLKEILKLDNLKSLYFGEKLIYGMPFIIEEINSIKYAIYKDSFFQVNSKGLILLYDVIKKYASKEENLLDLYCGCGSIGIYLSDNFKNILGVEINKDAIKGASKNKKLNKLDNISFICGDSSMISKKVDVLVVDPPRSGLSKKVISNIIKTKIKKIIYVSCNPGTLKRDLNILKEIYNIEEISAVNMFCKTEHIETITLLTLK